MPSAMYTITELANGRFSVKSSKGRTWKTTYPNRTSAEKGIAYVEKRFGGSSASVTSAPPTARALRRRYRPGA